MPSFMNFDPSALDAIIGAGANDPYGALHYSYNQQPQFLFQPYQGGFGYNGYGSGYGNNPGNNPYAARQAAVSAGANTSYQQAMSDISKNSAQSQLYQAQAANYAQQYQLDAQKMRELSRQFDLTRQDEAAKLQSQLEMARLDREEKRREFDLDNTMNQSKLALQREMAAEAARANAAGEAQAKQNLNERVMGDILNAPRGPADYFSYAARLPGLVNSGFLGASLGEAIARASGLSLDQLRSRPVTTNTQLTSTLVNGLNLSPEALAAAQQATAQANAMNPGAGAVAGTGAVVGANGLPMVTAPGFLDHTGTGITTPPGVSAVNPTTGWETSLQSFNRLEPTAQKLYMGLLNEMGAQTPEDFLSTLSKAAPNFASSSPSRLG